MHKILGSADNEINTKIKWIFTTETAIDFDNVLTGSIRVSSYFNDNHNAQCTLDKNYCAKFSKPHLICLRPPQFPEGVWACFQTTTKLPRTQMTSPLWYKHKVMVPNGSFMPIISFVGWKSTAATSASCQSRRTYIHTYAHRRTQCCWCCYTRFSAFASSRRHRRPEVDA